MNPSVSIRGAYSRVNRHRILFFVLLLAACAQTSGTVRGIVVGVEGSLDEVTSFTMLVDGEEMAFFATEDGDYAFPMSHLREHQRTGEPVLVTWEMKDGTRTAVALADG